MIINRVMKVKTGKKFHTVIFAWIGNASHNRFTDDEKKFIKDEVNKIKEIMLDEDEYKNCVRFEFGYYTSHTLDCDFLSSQYAKLVIYFPVEYTTIPILLKLKFG